MQTLFKEQSLIFFKSPYIAIMRCMGQGHCTVQLPCHKRFLINTTNFSPSITRWSATSKKWRQTRYSVFTRECCEWI